MTGLAVVAVWFVWIYIIFSIIKHAVKKSKDTGSKSRAKDMPPIVSMESFSSRTQQSVLQTVQKRYNKYKDNAAVWSLDNREDDWLAKQKRYEASVLQRDDVMSELKELHSRHCDADMLKKEHMAVCDAHDIDKGYH